MGGKTKQKQTFAILINCSNEPSTCSNELHDKKIHYCLLMMLLERALCLLKQATSFAQYLIVVSCCVVQGNLLPCPVLFKAWSNTLIVPVHALINASITLPNASHLHTLIISCSDASLISHNPTHPHCPFSMCKTLHVR